MYARESLVGLTSGDLQFYSVKSIDSELVEQSVSANGAIPGKEITEWTQQISLKQKVRKESEPQAFHDTIRRLRASTPFSRVGGFY